MFKRITFSVLLVLMSLAVASPAAALGTKWCVSEYQGNELCWRHCDMYDENGNWIGSITEDYNC